MTKEALQVQDQRILEMVVGIPVAWTSVGLRDEAESALTVRRKAQERGLSEQVQLQENYLRALAFFNVLAEMGITVKVLDGRFEEHSLNAELIPPVGVKVRHAMEGLPRPIKIEGWSVLKPVRDPDPYLAMKVAGRWYSIYQWD